MTDTQGTTCAHLKLDPTTTNITVDGDKDGSQFSRTVSFETFKCAACGTVVDSTRAYQLLAERVARLEQGIAPVDGR